MPSRASQPRRVAVVAGGPSSEAAVSRQSARGVAQALATVGHAVEVLELDADLSEALRRGGYDVVFPTTHGPLGEDGCLQGLLEVLGLPYVGSDVRGSAIAAHKPTAKVMFRSAGLKVANEHVVLRGEDLRAASEDILQALGPSLVIKPASGGSAIGVARLPLVGERKQLERALDHVLEVDDALVECFHQGAEVTCGVLDDGDPRALPPISIRARAAEWYDFKSRYQPGGSFHECPAPIGSLNLRRVEEIAVAAHRAVGARDLSRVDFVLTPGDEIILLEVNTLPGMTATSNFPEAAAVAGIVFPELCTRLIERALARPQRKRPEVIQIPGVDDVAPSGT